MKDKIRVQQLINELKSLAENDFERHRISVLERDLTSPPTVEIVDDNHQKFDGLTYVKKADEHYKYPVSIHRAVYAYYYGEIPLNHVIHHCDLNPEHNNINNLRLMTVSEHRTLHLLLNPISKAAPPKIKQCPICGNSFSVNSRSRRKYCSEACVKKVMSQSGKRRKKTLQEKQCPLCGKKFFHSSKLTKYCSNDCARKAISQSHIKTPLKKVCPICNKEFFTRRPNAKFCSHACADKNRQKPPIEKACPICGKIFIPNKNRQKTCSRSCAGKFSHKK